MTTMTATTTQVYQVFIRATPEQIWEAITKPEFTQRYFYGVRIDVRDGRRIVHGPDGEPWGDEQLLEYEIVYAGSPEKVGKQLVDLWDQFRFDEFLLICHYGGTRRWQAMKTQELFWKKVRPMLDAASEKASKKTVVAAA